MSLFFLSIITSNAHTYPTRRSNHNHHRHHHYHHHHLVPQRPPQRPPQLTPPSTMLPKCSINLLKLGLCLDVLGDLIHIGFGNPIQNTCCPILSGLLEVEAAVCLCTAIDLKLLNLNIYIPLALNVLLTCGMNPPPGYVCPVTLKP